MVEIKKDPIHGVIENGKKIVSVFKQCGFTVDNESLNFHIFKEDKLVGRSSCLFMCHIYGSSEIFTAVAEQIEKELGIDVIIYE